ncbi:MAG: hypothetical protein ACE5G8_12040 [Anaerolineae bacterium]
MNRSLALLFSALILLPACTPASAPAPPTALPATDTAPPAAAAAAATNTAPPAATATPPPDVSAATAPPATPVPTPAASPAPQGQAHFEDNLGLSDRLVVAAQNLPAPSAGAYVAWAQFEGSWQNLGTLQSQADGSAVLNWNSPHSENLLTTLQRVQITREENPGTAQPAGEVILHGELTPGQVVSAQRLFIQNREEPVTPKDTAYAQGLRAQAEVAAQHVQNAANAAAIGALPEAHLHLEHVINVLEGAEGERFGDHTGDGVAQNPGDGFGVRRYAGQIHLLLGRDMPAEQLVQQTIGEVEDMCLQIIALDDAEAVRAQLQILQDHTTAMQEQAVEALYRQAQQAITITLRTP